jgi:hypothetical membrane protein
VDDAFAARRFAWGLSQGLTLLSTAGGFWFLFGLFRGTSIAARGLFVILPVCVVVMVPVAALLAGAIRLRRIARFSSAILRASTERETARRELRQYAVVNLLQWLALVGVGVWATKTDHLGVMWSLFGILAGLHFIPIAKIWHVPAYGVMGIAMMIISALSILTNPPLRDLVLGVGNGAATWLTVWHLLRTVTPTTRQALGLAKT